MLSAFVNCNTSCVLINSTTAHCGGSCDDDDDTHSRVRKQNGTNLV